MTLSDHVWLRRYASGRTDLFREFYEPALEASRVYDRAVAYFRSSVFMLDSETFLRFAISGGKIRFACAPVLTPQDVAAIAAGVAAAAERAVSRDVDMVIEDLRRAERLDVLNILANLVA